MKKGKEGGNVHSSLSTGFIENDFFFQISSKKFY